jgi:hypothetical protein
VAQQVVRAGWKQTPRQPFVRRSLSKNFTIDDSDLIRRSRAHHLTSA